MTSIREVIIAIGCMLLTACASVSQVVPAGADTFLVIGDGHAIVEVSGVKLKPELYKKANRYCQNEGKSFTPIKESIGTYTAQLHFRCQ